VLVQHATLPDAEAHLTWREGVIALRNSTLRDAIAEFNRYAVRKIVIADPGIADLRIEGNFRSDDAAGFVELLQTAFPVRVTQQSNDSIVLWAK
jgi:transmembrane sensor